MSLPVDVEAAIAEDTDKAVADQQRYYDDLLDEFANNLQGAIEEEASYSATSGVAFEESRGRTKKSEDWPVCVATCHKDYNEMKISLEKLNKRSAVGAHGRLLKRKTGDTVFFEELGLGVEPSEKTSRSASVYERHKINDEIQLEIGAQDEKKRLARINSAK